MFNVTQVLINCLGWGLIAPFLDILVYSEPSNKVYAQGFLSAIVNLVTVGIGGSLLLTLYAKTRTKKGSLTKH